MPSALLVNPWIYDFAAFDYWAKPLGLLYIAENLRRKGLDVTFIDCLGAGEEKRYGAGPFLKEEIPKPRALQGIARRYSRYGISEETFFQSLTASPRPDIVLVTGNREIRWEYCDGTTAPLFLSLVPLCRTILKLASGSYEPPVWR